MADGKDGKDGKDGGQAGEQKLVVGDKTYTPAEIQQMSEKLNQLNQEVEKFAPVKAALTKYEVDPETLVTQAEGAFSVLNQLIDDGILDQDGKVKKGTEHKETPPAQKKDGSQPPAIDPRKLSPEVGMVLGQLKKMQLAIEGIQKTTEELDRTQSSIIRSNLEKEITALYPSLNSEDVSMILVQASKDRSKDIFAHAAKANEKKTQGMAALRAAHAKEFGVNLEEFDANKLKEPDSKKGAAAFSQGKKFSFRKGKDVLSPAQAAKEFLSKQFGG